MARNAPPDWPTTALAELIDITHGFAFRGEFFSDEPTDDVLVTPGNFAVGGGFDVRKPKYYAGPVEPPFVLNPGDLLITMTDLSRRSDTLGTPARVPESNGLRYLHNQRIGRVEIRDGSRLLGDYLYAVLRTAQYRSRVVASATGTTVKHTSPSRISEVQFAMPPIREQRAIAAVVGALDDKIGSNRRLAASLAEVVLCRTDHACKSARRTASLDELAEPVRVAGDPSLPYIGLDVMPQGSTVLSDWVEEGGPTGASWAFAPGDLLFGKLRPYFKKVVVAPLSGRCTREILVLRPTRTEFYGLIIGVVASQAFIDFCTTVSTGTKMPRSEWKDASRFEVGLPPAEVLDDLTYLARMNYARVTGAIHESRTLTAIRDALLPKLVSGQIRVPPSDDPGEQIAAVEALSG